MREPTETDAILGREKCVIASAVYVLGIASVLVFGQLLGVWLWVQVIVIVVLLYLVVDAVDLFFGLRKWSREHQEQR